MTYTQLPGLQNLDASSQPDITPPIRTKSNTIARLPVSSEANGAFAGELCSRARATGCVAVAPVSADVAWVLKRVGRALCEGRETVFKNLPAALPSQEVSRYHERAEPCTLHCGRDHQALPLCVASLSGSINSVTGNKPHTFVRLWQKVRCLWLAKTKNQLQPDPF